MSDWTPVDQVAKDDNGNYMALVNGQWVPALGGAKNDSGAYVAQLQSQPQTQVKEKPSYDKAAEWLLGEDKGTPKSVGESLKWIGEAGLGGMAAGGTLGAMLPAPGTAAAGAGLGGIAGAGGEALRQIAAKFGYGRAAQGGVELLAGGMAEPAVIAAKEAVPTAVRYALSRAIGPGGWAMTKGIKPGFENDPNIKQAVANSRGEMLAGRGSNALETLGDIFQNADLASQQATQSSIAARMEQLAAANAQRQAQLGNARNLAQTQHGAALQELEAAKQAGLGEGSSLYGLGTDIRNATAARISPEFANASSEYGAAYKQAMEKANIREAGGDFWTGTKEAQEFRKKWQDIAVRSSDPVKADIERVLGGIFKTKQQTTSEVNQLPGFGSMFPSSKQVTKTVPDHTPASAIDEYVRQLGQVYEKDAPEGYKAIGADIARKMRSDLTRGVEGKGGFYDWVDLGNAKGAYGAAMDKLAIAESKLGKHILAKDIHGQYMTDPEQLVNALSSTSGIQNLTSLLRDPAKAEQLVRKYAANETRGMSSQEVQGWLDKNPHISEVFGGRIANDLTAHGNKLGVLERRPAQLQQQIEAITSRMPTSAGQTARSQQLTGQMEQEGQRQLTGLFSGTSLGDRLVNPSIIGDKLFGSGLTEEGLTNAARALANNPANRNGKIVYDAAAQHLAKVSPENLPNSLNNIVTVLERGGFANPEQTAVLRNQVENIIRSSKGQFDKSAAFKAMFDRAWKQNMPASIAGQEGIRLFDAFNKNDKK